MSEEESGPLCPSARFDRVCTSGFLKGFARLSSFLCLYSAEKEIYFIRFSLEFFRLTADVKAFPRWDSPKGGWDDSCFPAHVPLSLSAKKPQSSPLPSASPLSRGDFFPRGAGNTRALSCGGTHSRKAGNTGTSRKCRVTACTKKILNEYWQLGTSMGPSLGIGNFYARYYRLAPLSPIRLLRRHLPIQDRCPAACFLYESVTLCTCSAVYKNCAALCCCATSGA